MHQKAWRMDGRTDGWTNNPEAICPSNFFEVGGIKILFSWIYLRALKIKSNYIHVKQSILINSSYFSLALKASCFAISFSCICCSILASLIFLRSFISCNLASLSACKVLRLSSTAASFANFSSCLRCLSSWKRRKQQADRTFPV